MHRLFLSLSLVLWSPLRKWWKQSRPVSSSCPLLLNSCFRRTSQSDWETYWNKGGLLVITLERFVLYSLITLLVLWVSELVPVALWPRFFVIDTHRCLSSPIRAISPHTLSLITTVSPIQNYLFRRRKPVASPFHSLNFSISLFYFHSFTCFLRSTSTSSSGRVSNRLLSSLFDLALLSCQDALYILACAGCDVVSLIYRSVLSGLSCASSRICFSSYRELLSYSHIFAFFCCLNRCFSPLLAMHYDHPSRYGWNNQWIGRIKWSTFASFFFICRCRVRPPIVLRRRPKRWANCIIMYHAITTVVYGKMRECEGNETRNAHFMQYNQQTSSFGVGYVVILVAIIYVIGTCCFSKWVFPFIYLVAS